ncbi:LamG-like jellyroll fold domain-containing protein [Flavivirga spongiicola]|uniref:LamG domain-containing protein n=1 Tax=Flavivirga spongiicola TaxID=421621 RepID=A0ABU7XX94_9FLAO|nr:LamG-like jellyroll fold domain-containing protein [Flavivirga sp. MEBiC05379]MDO5980070.1 LamG-like jellyroll fold domain-containing protein [Flavivirga sp. MEBiC05379]
MMKSKDLKYLSILLIGILFFGCQDLERLEFSDFPYDGPIITLLTPSASGSTVIRSTEPTASITIEFQVEDDLGLANITVEIDDSEIANISDFPNSTLFNVDDLTYDGLTTGSHTLVITATDTNGVVVTVTTLFEKADVPPYIPLFDGEIFYMPFDGNYTEFVSGSDATEVGSPSFAGESKSGSDAYAGAVDSYLTFPTTGLLGDEFSAAFWYKVNADPNRAGIFVIGPPDVDNPDSQNNRTSGFRLFREDASGMQRIKLNVGTGGGDSWFDGGALADIDPSANEWVHIAFSISGSQASVYIDGEVVREGDFAGVDWTGCDIMSIMSGAPRFTGWGHNYDSSYMDELRLFNKSISQSDVIGLIAQSSQILKMSFDGNYTEFVSGSDATEVGSPSFAGESKSGSDAYAGAVDSYLTFPTTGLLGDEFSAAFWYKVNADPNRAGIFVIGPPDVDNPDSQNNRTSGFRLFREDASGMQRIKLNVGTGGGDSWFDGGALADIDPSANEWVHIAFSISGSQASVYIDGEVVREGDFAGVDWTGCDIMSIMSGAPRFTGWGHNYDSSYMDELTLYSKALSQIEIQAIMAMTD